MINLGAAQQETTTPIRDGETAAPQRVRLTFNLLSIKWDLIRLGGHTHGVVAINYTQNSRSARVWGSRVLKVYKVVEPGVVEV